MANYNWTCCICGTKYPIKGSDWRCIHGCEHCKKGSWKKNMEELGKIIKIKRVKK